MALAPGRQIDAQPLYIYRADVHGGAKEAPIASAEGKTPHRERGCGGIDIVGIDCEVLSGDLEATQQGNLEGAQLHPAVKAGGNPLDQARPQDRLRPGEQDFEGGYQNDNNQQGADSHPKPRPMPAPLPGTNRLSYFCHVTAPFFSSAQPASKIPPMREKPQVTVHGSRTPAFAANGKWRVLFAGIAVLVTVSPLAAQQNQALSPPPSTGNIDTYIRQGWDSLSRSMAECKTLVDPKVTTPPVLYLPFGAPAPPELLRFARAMQDPDRPPAASHYAPGRREGI